jgi:energy-coupling factor transporter ATP-binding protein EcfA2
MLAGAVLLYGEDILELPTRQRARDIAVIFENPEWGFLCGTVEEDFVFSFLACGVAPPPLYALRRYGLFEAKTQSPEQLSGGEQQRLSCAPVMERKPKVIIGDFSSSNLDEEFRTETLHGWIESGSAAGQTFILRGIDPDELPRCDNVLAIEDNVLTLHPGSSVRKFVPSPSAIAAEVIAELGLGRQKPVDQPLVTAHEVKTLHAKGAVTANIRPGEVVLLVGPNGSGKTSFGRALIERPAISGLYIEATAGISMALQNPEHMLFSRTVAAELAGNGVLLALCGLAGEGKRQPLSLSRSKQKLVSIASACRLGADLIILDEPTVGLDPADFSALGRLMRHFAGKAFLIISHDPILHQVGREMKWTVSRIGSDQ